jgi:hypothetical protein
MRLELPSQPFHIDVSYEHLVQGVADVEDAADAADAADEKGVVDG